MILTPQDVCFYIGAEYKGNFKCKKCGTEEEVFVESKIGNNFFDDDIKPIKSSLFWQIYNGIDVESKKFSHKSLELGLCKCYEDFQEWLNEK